MAQSPTKKGEEASGRWGRDLVWALVWVEKGGKKQVRDFFGTSGCKMEDLESVCLRGGFEKKGRFVIDAAQRLDPPAATVPGVTAEIVLGMANMEQIGPQDIRTSVVRPTVETGQPAPVLGVRDLLAVLPPDRDGGGLRSRAG